MDFWDKETCEYCAGKIRERRIEVYRRINNGYVVIRNVPAGICQECGTKYYAANVLKLLTQRIKDRKAAHKKIEVPILTF
jgi:YgiT-type zinc finger domain-containing protein